MIMSIASAIITNKGNSPIMNCINGLKIEVIKYNPNPIIRMKVLTVQLMNRQALSVK